MGKARYEGYFEGTPTKLVKETFGDAKVYTQKKGIRVEISQKSHKGKQDPVIREKNKQT